MTTLTDLEARAVAPAVARYLRHLAHSRDRLAAKYGDRTDQAVLDAYTDREQILVGVLARLDERR